MRQRSAGGFAALWTVELADGCVGGSLSADAPRVALIAEDWSELAAEARVLACIRALHCSLEITSFTQPALVAVLAAAGIVEAARAVQSLSAPAKGSLNGSLGS
eukprot:6187308-Pleurochrysis_carterae.AAC.8